MAYTNAIAHNIAAIRVARKEGATARASKAVAKKETSLYAFLNTSTEEVKVTPPPVLSSDLWGEEKVEQKSCRQQKQSSQSTTEKSSEFQLVEQLCRLHNKNMFVRVKHPVRTDWMRLYSVILDLRETYGWSECRISNWLQFAREW